MIRKTIKRLLVKRKQQDLFLRTAKLESQTQGQYIEFKLRLDTGYEVHNLISSEVVAQLKLIAKIVRGQEEICHCLNGEQLSSIGTITLRWKGKGFRKVFRTTFHVIDGAVLPWQVILGAKTIHKHGILRFGGFGGFGGRAIMPKEKREDKENRKARSEQHKQEVEENRAKKVAHKKAKEDERQAASSGGYETRT